MKGSLFEVQPEWCRGKLEKKELNISDWVKDNHPEYVPKWERVLYFDPSEIYQRIGHLINPFERIHSIDIYSMFPGEEGFCACGCGRKLQGRSNRWFEPYCSDFAWAVRSIICNTHQYPKKFRIRYISDKCEECNEVHGEQLDHIIGVKHGGGGCWLSNYRWLCHKCHREKTNKDFGWKDFKKDDQLKIQL